MMVIKAGGVQFASVLTEHVEWMLSTGYSGPWKKINAWVNPWLSAYVKRAFRKSNWAWFKYVNIARNIQSNKDGVSIIETVVQMVRRGIERTLLVTYGGSTLIFGAVSK